MTNEQREYIPTNEAAIHAHIRMFESPRYTENPLEGQSQPEIQAQAHNERTVIDFSSQGIQPQVIEM